MTKHIFRSICLTALIVFLSSFVLIIGVLYGYFTKVQENQLETQTELAAQIVDREGIDSLSDLDQSSFRVTLIAKDGTVKYDSVEKDVSSMSNHKDREEVREAMQHGMGSSRRYSSTLLERTLYCAQKLNDGSVLRLSTSQSSVLKLIYGMLQPIIVIVVIAVVLSIILAQRLAQRIVKPLNEINLDRPLENQEYDELSPLLQRLNSQQNMLKMQQRDLDHKQTELNTIIDSMRDGMILLGEHEKIVSMNRAAMLLLGTDRNAIGRELIEINRSMELRHAVLQAYDGNNWEGRIVLNERSYQLIVSPIKTGDNINGVAVLLLDMTQKEMAESMRREFTANVSHELKTPLHSISGYAELLKYDMVKANDIKPFAEKIYSETQRMIHLVEDVINLSHLDEGAEDMEWIDMDLSKLAASVMNELNATAAGRDISIHLDAPEPCMIYAIPQLAHSIVFNLCENAIKYNYNGGTVSIEVSNEEDDVLLTVRDSGIGIPKEDIDRIFERFYRVDKSHSREIGGTGLGLSIVKHAVEILHAKISVESEVNKGTIMRVRFVKRPLELPED